MKAGTEGVVIFWSWQLDSPAQDNRNFIEDCLKRAAKRAAKAEAILISVDRDTKDVGGTPGIVETILAKIRSSDIFVWDATLVYDQPRPSPNPNVLIELGYALAIMGEGRLIGVMNIAGRPGPEQLPFDLKHRRWPLTYSFASRATAPDLEAAALESYYSDRKEVRDKLVDDFENAIRAALREPKAGALRSDVNLQTSRNLWRTINSQWMLNWFRTRMSNPQFEEDIFTSVFTDYVSLAQQPENAFRDDNLAELHETLILSINKYIYETAMVMQPHHRPGTYVIAVKASQQYVENYDEKYDRQVKVVRDYAKAVWSAWTAYVDAIRELYPEVTSQAEEQ